MKQLNPKAVWLFFINFASGWFILFIFFSIWGSFFFTGLIDNLKIEVEFSSGPINLLWIIIPAFLVFFFVFCFIWAKLTYQSYRYELTDTGFRKELGVVYKKYVTIPYDRIQNIDIYRGIWDRILGLSDLNIQTAGASAFFGRYNMAGIGAEGRLPGLSREVAEQLRDELMEKARQSKNQGL